MRALVFLFNPDGENATWFLYSNSLMLCSSSTVFLNPCQAAKP